MRQPWTRASGEGPLQPPVLLLRNHSPFTHKGICCWEALSSLLRTKISSQISLSFFASSSEVKASVCNAGDLGSIPGSGRFPWRRKATHSSTLAWKIPWTEEPGGLQSTGSQRVGHDLVTSLSLSLFFSYSVYVFSMRVCVLTGITVCSWSVV